MPVLGTFSLVRYEDGVLTIQMSPPVPVGGQEVRFRLSKRLGSETPIMEKFVASGYNAVSGIDVVNSGAGIFNIPIYGLPEMSGKEYGNYAFTLERMTSGSRTCFAEGFLTLEP